MKKSTAILLSFILIFVNLVPAFANTGQNSTYIPIKNAGEISGAEVIQDAEGKNVTMNFKGSAYQYQSGSVTGAKNGEAITLTAPPVDKDSNLYVNYDDVAFLFEDEMEQYKVAKKNAVTMTYSMMETYKIPGLTISLVDGETGYRWNRGFGYSDLELAALVSENTIFSLGSISKVFTAISVMQLVEQGKLNLDEKVVTYLPKFHINPHPVYGGDSKDITLRMLLGHYSGIPGDNFKSFYTTGTYNKGFMDHFVADLNSQYMDDDLNQRWSYANNGYTLLGVLIAKEAGYDSAFDGFVKYTNENIFKPMGMNSSTFMINDVLKRDLASSYYQSEAPKTKDLLVNALPAGGLYSTASDMSNFMSAMLNGGVEGGHRILQQSSIKTMADPITYNNIFTPQMKMGLGMYYTEYMGFEAVGHGGDISTFHSDMQFSLDDQLGVFISANSSSSAAIIKSMAILILKDAVVEKMGYNYYAGAPYITKPAQKAPENLNEVAGYYTGLGRLVVVDDYYLQLDGYQIYFTPQEDGSYLSEDLGRIWFRTMKDEQCVYLGDFAELMLGQKVDTVVADAYFEPLIGAYGELNQTPGNESIIASLNLYINDEGKPAMNYSLNDGQNSGEVLLQKVDNNTYYIAGKGRNYGKILQFQQKYNLVYLNVFGAEFLKQ